MIFESYKLSPNASFGTGLSLLVLQLVETGIVGVLLLVYPLARFPLYIIRRWRLFPNRQLRMAVFCMLGLAIILLLQVLYDSDMGAAGAWFLAWTHLGILTSLVMVRDPMRIFDAPFVGARRAVVPHEETGTHGPGPFMPQPQARRRVSILAIFDRRLWSVLVVTVLIVAACGLAALPYAASTLARRRVGEELSSYSYGQRVAMATRIFPLQSGLWAKLAAHLQQSAGSSIEMYERLPSIEAAYQRAIRANPYDARNYEQLAFLYSDTNNPSQAIKTLKLGVQNNPNHFVLRMLLVRELEKAGSLAMATHHVKQALFRIDPEQVELYLRLAELYDLRGMKDKAFVYYLYARQVVPDSAQSQVRLRRLRERFGIAF